MGHYTYIISNYSVIYINCIMHKSNVQQMLFTEDTILQLINKW